MARKKAIKKKVKPNVLKKVKPEHHFIAVDGKRIKSVKIGMILPTGLKSVLAIWNYETKYLA